MSPFSSSREKGELVLSTVLSRSRAFRVSASSPGCLQYYPNLPLFLCVLFRILVIGANGGESSSSFSPPLPAHRRLLSSHALQLTWTQSARLPATDSLVFPSPDAAAGKSTLLRILAGKRLTSSANALLLGRDVFRSPPEGVTYLGTEWALNVSSHLTICLFSSRRTHIASSLLFESPSSEATSWSPTFSTRSEATATRKDVIDFLRSSMSISPGESLASVRDRGRIRSLPQRVALVSFNSDPRFYTYRHMHEISDGERRRVQLVMGLMVRSHLPPPLPFFSSR